MNKNKIEIIRVISGVYWVEIPEAGLRILCACPSDTVKHLKKRGLIDIIEKNGVRYETGPNAILLSDTLIQNGYMSNLAEFPLLQMFYSQGMLIPNHPGNTGEKPILIGTSIQIKAQMEYFYRGNYGLVSKQEILDTGVSEEIADYLMHIKLKFAFGKIQTPDNLVVQLPIDELDKSIQIKNGVTIERIDHNTFQFSFGGETANVNLSLRPKEIYDPPYYLNYHKLNRDYFSVVHTGEGDAWDVNRPCMASVVIFQGKVYLVDAGPDLYNTLKALGVSINEVDGIFNTHAHDDHFAGLTTFIRSDHKIKYFSSAPVRASVAKKLCGLMSLDESWFHSFFDVCDLELDVWNNIEGLEVKPVLSPHPVETNIFYFRAFWNDNYQSYAHLADIASFRVLEENIFKNTETQNFDARLQKVKEDYLIEVDVKKIDIGGGLIHGEAKDFINDKTPKIMLAHFSRQLSNEEQQIGANAPFGSIDVLIETHQDFARLAAYQYFKFYFPQVPEYALQSLLNFPIITLNAGETLFRKNTRFKYVYMILTGLVELIYTERDTESTLSAGSLVGFYIDDDDTMATSTCRSTCHVTTIQIPVEFYLNFINKYGLAKPYDQLEANILFLNTTYLFQENVSLPVSLKIAQHMKLHQVHSKTIWVNTDLADLYLINKGNIKLSSFVNGTEKIETLKKGDFFGGEKNLVGFKTPFSITFTEDCEVWQIPYDILVNIPIVFWKMLDTAEQRKAFFTI
ncbi:MAG: MBL fold metallo-hydrolase [Bacteroidetes bacterium]|nr:MAG: MBL fold metallo-hydrolase [Bacteroidota bacterium]